MFNSVGITRSDDNAAFPVACKPFQIIKNKTPANSDRGNNTTFSNKRNRVKNY